MKLGNYIKRTAVRRVVWIVVGLIVTAILSAFGVAHAQQGTTTNCPQSPLVCDRGEAYADIARQAAEAVALNPCQNLGGGSATRTTGNFQVSGTGMPYVGRLECAVGTNQTISWMNWGVGVQQAWGSPCGPDAPWNEEFKRCNNCASQPNFETNTNVSLSGPPAAYICRSSCEFMKKPDPPGLFCGLVEEGPNVGYWCNSEYSATGSMCTGGGDGTSPGDGAEPPPTDPDAPPRACGVGEVRLPSGNCAPRGQCPLGQYEENGVCRPAGSCPAGQVKGPDGSCIPTSCPAGQAMGQDGTCKADTNDDGTPDEEEPGGDGTNTDGMEFSGGESCEVPPTCSGDAIMCGQARIQWRIDCNTRKNSSVSGGNSCAPGSAPVCTGSMCDAVDQVKMLQLWESNCALQRLAEGSGEGDGIVGDLSGVEDRLDRIGNFLDGDGDCMATDGGCGDGDGDHWIDGDDVEASEWSSGLASTGSCPAPISRTISLGQHVQDIEFSFQPLCDFAALLRWVLITAATILSALLIGGFRSNA